MDNTERTQEPGICLTVDNRDSYSQQKGEWIGRKCPAQLITMGGFLSFSAFHPEAIPGNMPEETLLNCPVHWEDRPCPVAAGVSKDGVKAA